MSSSYKEQFIAKLEEYYGSWEKLTSHFGNANFGKIAEDLCISASQFSKLISGSATEGMYIRALKNIERLAEEKKLREERDAAVEQWAVTQREVQKIQKKDSRRPYKIFLFTLVALLGGALAAFFYTRDIYQQPVATYRIGQHPLSPYFDKGFDADFNSPYLKESEVQDFCPCSAYEGTWSLSEPYKLPLPGNRKPGVYYLAKSADVRMKCSKSDTAKVGRGNVLLAYEYLINEIWVDTQETPLSPTYFDKEKKAYTPEFMALTFEDDPQFKKVATIHSFFIDKFEIYQDSILRKGEPCGRFATDVDQQLVVEYEIDLKHILENVLGDLTQAECQATANPYCDPNDLRENESVISFDCLYTIKAENLGIGGGYPYRKGYRLEKQSYSDNLTCSCE